MSEEARCIHCGERPVADIPEELLSPAPETFPPARPPLCRPCFDTADAWLTPAVWVSYFPWWVRVPDR